MLRILLVDDTHLGGAGAHGINALTSSAFDPVSRQPELKHCAVRITKAELPWRLAVFGYAPDADAVALAQAARRWLQSFPYATCVLVGGERCGVLFRAAAPTPPDRSVIAHLDALFGLDDHRTLSYEDARRGVGRRVRVHESRIEAVRLAGDLAAEPWLRELFDSGEPVTNLGPLLLAPAARAPSVISRGRIVCACWNVSERAICDVVTGVRDAGADAVASVQEALKCGTQCGSCLPEVKRLAAAGKAAA